MDTAHAHLDEMLEPDSEARGDPPPGPGTSSPMPMSGTIEHPAGPRRTQGPADVIVLVVEHKLSTAPS